MAALKLKAVFTRIAPGIKTEELPLGWVAISHRYVDDKKQRRKLRGSLVRLKSEHGTVYRTLKFSPRLKFGESQMLLDWEGWIALCDPDDERAPVEVEVTPASWYGAVYHSMSHPDPAYRHSMAVARISVYIAIISLILAFK